jgi:hypothetical protein
MPEVVRLVRFFHLQRWFLGSAANKAGHAGADFEPRIPSVLGSAILPKDGQQPEGGCCESSRYRIRRRDQFEARESSGDQRKIFVDRFIDQAIASLMLTFTAEAICTPGDDQAMLRIAESHRALRAPVPKR